MTLVEQIGFSKSESKDLVDMFFEQMKDTLTSGEEIKIHGFGNFRLREKQQRPGRNPKTKEDYTIAARRVVLFKSSKLLKQRIAINYNIPSANEVDIFSEVMAELISSDEVV